MTQLCRESKRIFSLDNLEIHQVPPVEVVEAAIAAADPSSVFLLFAVLEHMTEEERIETLSGLWQTLGPDNYIFIGNTPNRLSY